MTKINNSTERIGFEIKNNKLKLVLPDFIKEKEFNESKSTDEKIKYFRLFRKYNQYSRELKEESLYKSQNFKSEQYMYSIFEAYYLLLMDYMESGPFVFIKRKTNHNKKGRLNWNRTINKSNLIISGDNLIYDNPYYKNNNILYTHPLTILYGIYLIDIEKFTGIKMNLNNQYKNIIKDSKRSINIKEVLNNYRFSMYTDRQRKVFEILGAINNNNRKLNKTSTNNNLYYLEHLNNLWEYMLKIVLEDEYYSFNNNFPKGMYDLNIEGYIYSKSGFAMIPDIIKEYNNKLYIIDAKNYLPHINKNIPGTSDINKQILYRVFLSKEFNSNNKYNIKDIKNVFLLPNDLQGDIIKKIGMHEFKNTESIIGNIYLYQVDFDCVVNSYLNKDKQTKEIILKILSNNKII